MSPSQAPPNSNESSGSEEPPESTGQTDHIELLVIDDHPTIRSAIRSAAGNTSDIKVVGEAESSEEAFQLLEHREPDVAIVDLSLSDGHGFDLLENLQACSPNTQSLVFSMYDESVYAKRVLQTGASGYLMKAVSTSEVLQAVRHVHEGGVYLSEKMTRQVLKKMVANQAEEARLPLDELTDRELQIFQMLGRGHTLSEIAERLSLARKTVEAYRRRAKEKLGVKSAEKVVAYAAQWIFAQGKKNEEKP